MVSPAQYLRNQTNLSKRPKSTEVPRSVARNFDEFRKKIRRRVDNRDCCVSMSLVAAEHDLPARVGTDSRRVQFFDNSAGSKQTAHTAKASKRPCVMISDSVAAAIDPGRRTVDAKDLDRVPSNLVAPPRGAGVGRTLIRRVGSVLRGGCGTLNESVKGVNSSLNDGRLCTRSFGTKWSGRPLRPSARGSGTRAFGFKSLDTLSKGLILAQNERWRRGSGMQVGRAFRGPWRKGE